MNETYSLTLSPRGYNLGVSQEDDPARSRYLDKLLREKRRPQSNWREVLAKPMEHQRWVKQADEEP